jgi:hypothetical protein
MFLLFAARLALLALVARSCPAPRGIAGEYVKDGDGVIEVKAQRPEEVSLVFAGTYRTNTCNIETEALKVEKCKVIFTSVRHHDCRIEVTFGSRKAQVDQKGDCGCGLNVDLSGAYRKRSRSAKSVAGQEK